MTLPFRPLLPEEFQPFEAISADDAVDIIMCIARQCDYHNKLSFRLINTAVTHALDELLCGDVLCLRDRDSQSCSGRLLPDHIENPLYHPFRYRDMVNLPYWQPKGWISSQETAVEKASTIVLENYQSAAWSNDSFQCIQPGAKVIIIHAHLLEPRSYFKLPRFETLVLWLDWECSCNGTQLSQRLNNFAHWARQVKIVMNSFGSIRRSTLGRTRSYCMELESGGCLMGAHENCRLLSGGSHGWSPPPAAPGQQDRCHLITYALSPVTTNLVVQGHDCTPMEVCLAVVQMAKGLRGYWYNGAVGRAHPQLTVLIILDDSAAWRELAGRVVISIATSLDIEEQAITIRYGGDWDGYPSDV